MTYSLLTSLKTFALGTALRAMARKSKPTEAVRQKPRVRTVQGDFAAQAVVSDAWMFERSESSIDREVNALTTEMSRVSGTLTGLRAVLSNISAYNATSDAFTPNIAFGDLQADSALFDGEPMAASFGEIPCEDADLFTDESYDMANVA